MRSIASCLVVLLVVATTTEAAVLVRFINAVPQRFNQAPLTAVPANGYADVTNSLNTAVDRVGLQYFPSQSQRTVVWTELATEDRPEVTATTAVAPFAYTFAMPPLRGAHRMNAQTTVDVDQVATFAATQHTLNGDPNDPSICSTIEQTGLKADGVGLYLSFAPGTYQLGAYGVRGALTSNDRATAQASTYQRYASSGTTLSFEDNKVYTLIAYGNGNFASDSFGTSGNVRLVLLEESTASATFGFASLRFFHAIQSASTDSIDIQDTTQNNVIVTGLAFGSATSYLDVAPRTRRDFAVVKSSNKQVPIAPTDSLALGASFDVRAGTRATVICANTDNQNPTVFCRMIPSRVVAYVRLINDNAGNLNYVQGRFAAQRIQDVSLTLWASYALPFPSQVQELSQNIQARCARNDGSAFLSKGLYPVVTDVAINTVSDYGEVHVPLFLMDYAVRPVIRETDCRLIPSNNLGGAVATATDAPAAYTRTTDDPQNPTNDANTRWFDMSPVFKRVNFVLKTDGFSTLTGRTDSAARKRLIAADTRKTLVDSLLLNEYMEPGQYYSLLATAAGSADATTLSALQLPKHTSFKWRLDRDLSTVSSGISSTVGNIRVVPLFGQDFSTSQVSLSGRTALVGGFTNNFITAAATKTGKTAWTAPTASEELSLTPGSYTFTPQGSSSCDKTIPSGTANVAAGKLTEVFTLGTYSCQSQSTPLVVVQKTPALFNLATSSSCTTSAPPTFMFAAAGTATPSSLLVLVAAAIIAALMAML